MGPTKRICKQIRGSAVHTHSTAVTAAHAAKYVSFRVWVCDPNVHTEEVAVSVTNTAKNIASITRTKNETRECETQLQQALFDAPSSNDCLGPSSCNTTHFAPARSGFRNCVPSPTALINSTSNARETAGHRPTFHPKPNAYTPCGPPHHCLDSSPSYSARSIPGKHLSPP